MLRSLSLGVARGCSSAGSLLTRAVSTSLPVASGSSQEAIPGIDVEPSADLLRKARVQPVLLKPYVDPVLHNEDHFEMAKEVSIADMFAARVHYGHRIGTLNDNMKWALYGERQGICVFDLNVTQKYLIKALNFLAHVSYRGGMVLFVTSDKANMLMVEKMATDMGQYSHTRKWQEGTLTNTGQLFGASVRLPDVIVFLSTLSSVLERHPGVVEAAKMTIPTIGICDSNAEPNYVTYPVPGSDDSTPTLKYYMQLFKLAVDKGREAREKAGNA
uniref:Small ribosomal subunit protein uS2m n=1 Tax=Panagrellus redivivus TaxID=6233 RepID=A0A7E4ZQC8_PANRE